nr:unnamed protein product [Digitaria exilis]
MRIKRLLTSSAAVLAAAAPTPCLIVPSPFPTMEAAAEDPQLPQLR